MDSFDSHSTTILYTDTAQFGTTAAPTTATRSPSSQSLRSVAASPPTPPENLAIVFPLAHPVYVSHRQSQRRTYLRPVRGRPSNPVSGSGTSRAGGGCADRGCKRRRLASDGYAGGPWRGESPLWAVTALLGGRTLRERPLPSAAVPLALPVSVLYRLFTSCRD
ncbi:hypothetical protein BU23DRAFT_15749 [Bimuria novae-zelandiae CBS 107.79]|uniref:Uncharacterized protein n=1 Tax=Bimuria novae-zelandiae CBS 107.79 TaxID=1447943 RepID=A0A6A5VIA5_9PLEO|nr:hypothetical protein BU23DRAFT_15749 [Bimuria novae-zelandiae CBS 107.79]